jgi:poly [ADP-ribose] polymerase
MIYNFLGILSQGLRIAPPEAPSTGALFGKGLYFADMFGKANSYAQSWNRRQD